MKNRVLIVAILLKPLLTISSYADWQYTKWGMSSEQIIRASKGKAFVSPDQRYRTASYDPSLEAPFRSGPLEFTARFEIKVGVGLALVTLSAVEASQCGAIQSALIGKYGEADPAERRQFGHLKWYDRKANNIIVAYEIGSKCSVLYRPIAAKGAADGL